MPSLLLLLAPKITGVSGVTIDQLGARLPFCTVHAFNSVTMTIVATTTSDANGNYSMDLPAGNTYFLVAYLSGTPNLAGTSVNTISV